MVWMLNLLVLDHVLRALTQKATRAPAPPRPRALAHTCQIMMNCGEDFPVWIPWLLLGGACAILLLLIFMTIRYVTYLVLSSQTLNHWNHSTLFFLISPPLTFCARF